MGRRCGIFSNWCPNVAKVVKSGVYLFGNGGIHMRYNILLKIEGSVAKKRVRMRYFVT